MLRRKRRYSQFVRIFQIGIIAAAALTVNVSAQEDSLSRAIDILSRRQAVVFGAGWIINYEDDGAAYNNAFDDISKYNDFETRRNGDYGHLTAHIHQGPLWKMTLSNSLTDNKMR